MNLGLVCMRKCRGFKKGFSGIKALQKASNTQVRSKLSEASIYNLKETISNIQYCIDNNIYAYRASSNVIPFYEFWDWESNDEILRLMWYITKLSYNNNIVLTIHPDQFTVLCSPKQDVVDSSIQILSHHYKLAEYMGIKHIILHVGGVYNNKDQAMTRFIDNFMLLPELVQKLIRLENCHSYDIDDVLLISDICGVDVCFDFHHQRVIHGDVSVTNYLDIMKRVVEQNKCVTITHISSGKSCPSDKSHADFISVADINLFSSVLSHFMSVITEVEAKNKEQAIYKIGILL